MTQIPAFEDDGTGRIRTAATKEPPSNPSREMIGLEVAFIAHEQSDARRWRTLSWLIGIVGTLVVAVGTAAWSANAAAAAAEARLESMQRQLDHIEQQVDRLMERTDR